jgi:peptidoglycan/LPS O-acetylase OafA/YrhL
MKRCPKCNQEFDDELRFCLEDGTALVSDEMPATVAAPTMVLPTSQEVPPTLTQAARPDVPPPPHLAATRTAADIETANSSNSGSSRTVIVIGILLVAGLLFSLGGLGTSGIFYARRTPMILLCLFGMVLAMIRAKKHSRASLMVGISLGFYLVATFVISTAYNYIPRIDNAFHLRYQTVPLILSVVDSFAFATVILLLIGAVFAGRSPRSKVYN